MIVPITVLTCIIVSCVVCFIAYKKDKEREEYNKLTDHDRHYIRLYMIEYAYNDYKNNLTVEYVGFEKMRMFENMDKSMSILKSCLQQLIREGIIEEKTYRIKITGFGQNYYEKILRK